MKSVIIVHKHLKITGVTTFLSTIYKELSKKHDVEVAFLIPGYSGTLDIQDNNIKVYPSLQLAIQSFKFTRNGVNYVDEVWFSYRSQYELLNPQLNSLTLTKFIRHGTMDSEYQYPPTIDQVYCLSPRSLELTKHNSKILISNYINTSYFNVANKPPRTSLQRILIIDARMATLYSNALFYISKIFNVGITVLTAQDGTGQLVRSTKEYIEEADLVIGYGRSVLEAMSMGKCVLIFGANGGDGYVNERNMKQIAYRNFSGWATKKINSPLDIEGKFSQQLVQEIAKYDPKDGHKNREYLLEHNRISPLFDTLEG